MASVSKPSIGLRAGQATLVAAKNSMLQVEEPRLVCHLRNPFQFLLDNRIDNGPAIRIASMYLSSICFISFLYLSLWALLSSVGSRHHRLRVVF